MEIISILCCLSAGLDHTTLRRLAVIVTAILTMPDKVTMLAILKF